MSIAGKALFGLLLTGAAYGGIVLWRQKQLLDETDIDYAGITVGSFNEHQASVLLRLKIINKSAIRYTITGQKYEAYLNGVKAAKVNSVGQTVVPPKGSAIATVEILFDPSEVFKTGLASIMKSGLKNTSVRIKGSLSVLSSIVVIGSLPIDETFKLSDL